MATSWTLMSFSCSVPLSTRFSKGCQKVNLNCHNFQPAIISQCIILIILSPLQAAIFQRISDMMHDPDEDDEDEEEEEDDKMYLIHGLAGCES